MVISSDDGSALTGLKLRIEYLKERHDLMKDMNKHFRDNKTLKGFGTLTDEQAQTLDSLIEDSAAKKPYPNWQLQSNYKGIRAAEERLRELEKELNPQKGNEYDTEQLGFRSYENKDIMRLQLHFDVKPEEDIRTELEKHGFKWSPSNACWQRLLNTNARISLNCFINFMTIQQSKKQMVM